jgi:hypothetical protein
MRRLLPARHLAAPCTSVPSLPPTASRAWGGRRRHIASEGAARERVKLPRALPGRRCEPLPTCCLPGVFVLRVMGLRACGLGAGRKSGPGAHGRYKASQGGAPGSETRKHTSRPGDVAALARLVDRVAAWASSLECAPRGMRRRLRKSLMPLRGVGLAAGQQRQERALRHEALAGGLEATSLLTATCLGSAALCRTTRKIAPSDTGCCRLLPKVPRAS